MKTKIILFLTIIIISACNNLGQSNDDGLTLKTLTQLTPDTDFNNRTMVLIVPFDGCSSCFAEATKLIPDILNASGVVIVPNRLKKRIDNYIKNIGVSKYDIIMDTLQLSMSNKLVEFNPKVFVINNNKITYSKTVQIQSIKDIRAVLFK